MSRRLLVVTSVHPADDPRIREKYIRTLADTWDVTYASKAPGPTDGSGLVWRPLRGGRVRRWFAAARTMLTVRADAIAVHDPELIPAAILVSRVRAIPVVFDLHENVPAQLRARATLPSWARSPLAALSRFWLSWADRSLVVTLAEDGYRSLFASNPPVFPNYLDTDGLPEVGRADRSGVIYVGDVTRERGALTLVDAAERSRVGPVTFVGRCSDDLRRTLIDRAAKLGAAIELLGWQPHHRAMELAARAAVGVSPLHDTPNYRNSLPTKTLEYLAMGTPVVASDLPGTRTVIGSLPGVQLVPADDVNALANAISSVDQRTVNQARGGAETVRDRYQWPTSAVVSFYDSLVGG